MENYTLDPQLTLPRLISARAVSTPDRVYVRHVNGPDLTYAEVDRACRQWAQVIRDQGVAPGECVSTMLFPSADSLCAWVGISLAGAIDAGVNTGFRGRMLHYVIELARSEVLVVDASLVDRLREIEADLTRLRLVLVVGEVDADALPPGRLPMIPMRPLVAAAEPVDAPGPDHWDTSCLICTSGTTGPSKAVVVPWGQLYTFCRLLFRIEELGDDEVYLNPFPAYHTSGRCGAYLMALVGGTVVFMDHFRLTTWLDEVKRFGVTMMILFPLMLDQLREAPPSSDDANISLRRVIAQTVPDHEELSKRYDLRMRIGFTMTEAPPFIMPGGWGQEKFPSIGKLHQGFPGYDARLVDENDQDVPVGTPGQLIVRSATPWTMNAGYFRDAEATAKAWRNGWFHTGDMLRVDEEGLYYFLDRMTDSIRRRGENISSVEVEAYVLDHPEVAECAAIAAPLPEHREQEVKVLVRCVEGSALTPPELMEYLASRMPRFMTPRFLEFVDDFPRTPGTMKIRKVELRVNPINENTWDSKAGQPVSVS